MDEQMLFSAYRSLDPTREPRDRSNRCARPQCPHRVEETSKSIFCVDCRRELWKKL